MDDTGSSPLARGLQTARYDRMRDQGIIPARAGFTGRGPHRHHPRPDHPRSRGVYSTSGSTPPWRRGSSPLARGLRVGDQDVRGEPRIIPARAGFTAGLSGPHRSRTDHPRSRGVYTRPRPTATAGSGSSPLARGLRGTRPRRARDRGIIPARAGFTGGAGPSARRRADHPRSRGVYSPSTASRSGASWIIPARAGFTCVWAGWRLATGDHPRSRGVYRGPAGLRPGPPGSSPLARGLRVDLHDKGWGPGIIPARAGFTPGSTGRARVTRDHPRSRGVYLGAVHSRAPSQGSSPLARGLPVRGLVVKHRQRIIPARAGFTPFDSARERDAQDVMSQDMGDSSVSGHR